MPLHLCRIADIMLGITLLVDNKKFYKILYFIGLTASLPALITPDLVYNFPHFAYFKFFIAHGGMLTSVPYITFIKKCRPSISSVLKSFLYLNLFLPFVELINLITGDNYFYLANKPPGFSLMNYLGNWPWYILSMEIIVILLFLIFYIPFF